MRNRQKGRVHPLDCINAETGYHRRLAAIKRAVGDAGYTPATNAQTTGHSPPIPHARPRIRGSRMGGIRFPLLGAAPRGCPPVRTGTRCRAGDGALGSPSASSALGCRRIACGTGALAGQPNGDTVSRRGRRLEHVPLLVRVLQTLRSLCPPWPISSCLMRDPWRPALIRPRCSGSSTGGWARCRR